MTAIFSKNMCSERLKASTKTTENLVGKKASECYRDFLRFFAPVPLSVGKPFSVSLHGILGFAPVAFMKQPVTVQGAGGRHLTGQLSENVEIIKVFEAP